MDLGAAGVQNHIVADHGKCSFAITENVGSA
jgi:hypothetical protein